MYGVATGNVSQGDVLFDLSATGENCLKSVTAWQALAVTGLQVQGSGPELTFFILL